MKKKFEVLQHSSLSQIQMWLNQKNTIKGNVVIESPLTCDHNNVYILIISYND
jgi:hypothetical protein